MKRYVCKRDVLKGDIVTAAGRHYVVIDDMNSNNGNFRAKDSKGRLTWLNTLNLDSIDRRRDTSIIYI